MGQQTAVTPTRAENYPEWYQQVIKVSDLAEPAPVRGCMVIKPWGYALWENIQRVLDQKFKETGHVNAYFPLLIPMSFLAQEAKHVEGFAKECAVVTHHRLEARDGTLVPAGELEEPLVIRPTSETIIGHMFAKWVQSYRDLPILMNQWCNIMRWEMRTRMFLRTSEFLWQEGHTVHATKEEAIDETLKMLNVYSDFCHNYMAMPVIKGEKTADERFPGAVNTYCVEAMMQDGKALQAGTSHFLGQNFSKASQIKFNTVSGEEQYAWTTSWGVSTRLIGGLIMTHSDDNGLVLPPKLAPQQIVLMPIYKKEAEKSAVMEYVNRLASELRAQRLDDLPLRVEIDSRDMGGGEKAWHHIKRGVPLRAEVGPRDMAQNSVFLGRRDREPKEKASMPYGEFVAKAPQMLLEMQNNLLAKAKSFQEQHIVKVKSVDEFSKFFESQIGFVKAHWNPAAASHPLLEQYKVTPRCIPIEEPEEAGTCIFTGKPSSKAIYLGRSY